MITTLVVSTLVCTIIWLVRYVRDYRAVTRELRSFPGAAIASPTPPTLAEIGGGIPQLNGGFLIPPDRVASYVLNGSGRKVWTPGLGQRQYATGGVVLGGVSVHLNEHSDYRIPAARTTVVSAFQPANAKHGDVWIDRATGEVHVFSVPGMPTCQHPNPEPVVLTTDEVVAGVCPDCLQPLPPSSVGSEWKP